MGEDETRDRILAAAATLIADRGYVATTIRAIAAAAGVNEVTLFRHFGNKAGVVRALTPAGPRVRPTPTPKTPATWRVPFAPWRCGRFATPSRTGASPSDWPSTPAPSPRPETPWATRDAAWTGDLRVQRTRRRAERAAGSLDPEDAGEVGDEAIQDRRQFVSSLLRASAWKSATALPWACANASAVRKRPSGASFRRLSSRTSFANSSTFGPRVTSLWPARTSASRRCRQRLTVDPQRPSNRNSGTNPANTTLALRGWEGDLIARAAGASTVGTLVERSTRFVMLLALPNGRTAASVHAAPIERIQQLPEVLKRSLTWDRGAELAEHEAFTVATGVRVYFCDPRSPWRRGSDGLLRPYLPRSMDLNTETQAKLDSIAEQLNTRPRKSVDRQTPAHALAQVLQGSLETAWDQSRTLSNDSYE